MPTETDLPSLDILTVTVEPDYDSLIPALRFKFQISNTNPNEPIHTGLIVADVFLKEAKDRWIGKLFIRIPETSQPFEQVDTLPLSIDANNVMWDSLKQLQTDELVFILKFYGYCSYGSSNPGPASHNIFLGNRPEIQKTASMPVDRWRRLLSTYYRNLTWVAIGRDTYEVLRKIMEEQGLTPDEAIKRLLSRRTE